MSRRLTYAVVRRMLNDEGVIVVSGNVTQYIFAAGDLGAGTRKGVENHALFSYYQHDPGQVVGLLQPRGLLLEKGPAFG